MAAVYSNSLNLFHLTAKASPVGADLIAIGDSAVTGVPLKQCTITQLSGAITATSGLTWIASVTAASSATIDFSKVLSATYDNYLIVIENYVPATNNTVLQLRVGTGGTPTYQTSSYVGVGNNVTYGTGAYTSNPVVLASGTGAMDLNENQSGALMSNGSSTSAGMGTINITNVNNASNYKTMTGLISYLGNGSTGSGLLSNVVTGQWQSAIVINSLRFLSSSGNISTGVFKLYGYQN